MYKELNEGIQEFGYEIFGLRKDDLEYKIGDILPNKILNIQILHVQSFYIHT